MPSQGGHIRQLDIEVISVGQILLDSGSTAHMPTKNGLLQVNEVYHCKGVKGTILSTGRLADAGWRLDHEGTSLLVTDPGGWEFETVFRNFC